MVTVLYKVDINTPPEIPVPWPVKTPVTFDTIVSIFTNNVFAVNMVVGQKTNNG